MRATPMADLVAEPSVKYDRQLRIWGEHGQAALENASVCLLNCGPTGSETLKNLVLGGVGSITVIDGSLVEESDLGNNFMVDERSVGKSKAKCVCTFLRELNDSVKANFIEEYPEVLIETSPTIFSQFTLIIATQLVESHMVKIDNFCRDANVMLVFARSYGLAGLIRISVKEHLVIESNPDHFLDDLRLNNPWPELKKLAESIDLNVVDTVVHKHIPYVVILVKMAEDWIKGHGGNLPCTRDEKIEFKELLKARMIASNEDNYQEAIDASFKVYLPKGIGPLLQNILNDSCCEVDSNSSDFWVMVAALKAICEFAEDLPKKAEADFLDISRRVVNILKKIGRDPDSISNVTIRCFCRNAKKLRICRYHHVEDEFAKPSVPQLQKYLIDEDYSYSAWFYILFRAVDRFKANYSSFPGQFSGGMDEDVSRLKNTTISLLSDLSCNGSTINDDLIKEMCRFGASELHAVAAFIGGVASQEAIKLITKQFVPLSGTFVFNGIDQKSQLLTL